MQPPPVMAISGVEAFTPVPRATGLPSAGALLDVPHGPELANRSWIRPPFSCRLLNRERGLGVLRSIHLFALVAASFTAAGAQEVGPPKQRTTAELEAALKGAGGPDGIGACV